ncbi:MAG: AAA family ATPase [Bryobacterales bacterium]|nr:AAA family ATPase [Bryobacterales bacterium]
MGFSRDERRLPIGVQSFLEIRAANLYYVDKTGFALRLVRDGKHYFVWRPRRFGKSLFVDTLKRLFKGRRELFKGLAIEPDWDWSVRYPVVRLDFGKGNFKRPGYLHANVMAQLDRIGREAGLELRYDTAPDHLDDLIRALHGRCGQRVVILVDERDKPILDALEQPEIASENRDDLRGLYSVIKSCDDHLHFSLLTGVSKFSKASLFSGLNNLKDITLTPRFSSICGYTERDLDTVFADRLEGLDREDVRDWYSGYSWSGDERVYNPFDVLLLLDEREYKNW